MATMGVLVRGFGGIPEQTAGSMMVAVSLIFMIYGVWLFRWRANRLKAHSLEGYTDSIGPYFMSALVVSVMCYLVYFMAYDKDDQAGFTRP